MQASFDRYYRSGFRIPGNPGFGRRAIKFRIPRIGFRIPGNRFRIGFYPGFGRRERNFGLAHPLGTYNILIDRINAGS